MRRNLINLSEAPTYLIDEHGTLTQERAGIPIEGLQAAARHLSAAIDELPAAMPEVG